MSRAFVKEPDGEAVGDDAPELPISPYPNLVTPRGLAMLRAELERLTDRRRAVLSSTDPLARRPELFSLERQIRYVNKRIETAIVQDPRDQAPGRVGFGALVTVLDEDGSERRFTIVGEDEANPREGRISSISPLAKALLGSAVGDEVRWRRPKGDTVLEVVGIDYADGDA